MFGTSDVQPLHCVECDAFGNGLEVTAKLAQNIPSFIAHDPQVDESSGAVAIERRGMGNIWKKGHM